MLLQGTVPCATCVRQGRMRRAAKDPRRRGPGPPGGAFVDGTKMGGLIGAVSCCGWRLHRGWIMNHEAALSAEAEVGCGSLYVHARYACLVHACVMCGRGYTSHTYIKMSDCLLYVSALCCSLLPSALHCLSFSLRRDSLHFIHYLVNSSLLALGPTRGTRPPGLWPLAWPPAPGAPQAPARGGRASLPAAALSSLQLCNITSRRRPTAPLSGPNKGVNGSFRQPHIHFSF
jgi:hypothetical protein